MKILQNINVVFAILLFHFQNVTSYKVETEEHAISFLVNYGYVDPKIMPRGFSLYDCGKKLKEFQRFSRIPETGNLDKATLKAMNTPRCGCPDFIKDDGDFELMPKDEGRPSEKDHHFHHHHRHHHNHTHHRNHNRSHHYRGRLANYRSKRYAVSSIKWEKQVVSYRIQKFPTRQNIKVSNADIELAIHKAFNIWEQHINLEFSYQPNAIEADIEISFEAGYHGDGYPFDGPGSTLAHAFFPGRGIGGDIHFEEEEDWRIGVYNGVDILYVATHEIGHSLGIGHSSDYSAVMYPAYRGYKPDLKLAFDDIHGAQALYGIKHITPVITTQRPTTTRTTTRATRKPTTIRNWRNATRSTTTTTLPPSRPSDPEDDLCLDERVDAIATLYDDAILVFKGSKVYEIGRNGQGVLTGWPKNIKDYFKGVEEDLDCVLTRSNGKTYFFKDAKYWRFTGRQMDGGYPRAIAEHFPGIPNNLDAAFEWDGEFVFTKGNQFWRYNSRRRPQVRSHFPMHISHWGLSKRLDAAFASVDGSVYFVQGMFYWKFDKDSHKIINDGQWPGLLGEDWLGCQEP